MNQKRLKKLYSEEGYSQEIIFDQLQRILTDPVFQHSDILKRFLQFIVDETLCGNANQLKEYTIAIKILNKPLNFNPQQNGIVRIHAGRLRRSLDHYYNGPGINDPLRISIPKGKYVPVFSDNSAEDSLAWPQGHETDKPNKESTVLTVAVIPFNHSYCDNLNASFADGLGLQLSDAFTNVESCSVVAYYTMRKVLEKFTDIKMISSIVGAHYIVTGDMQSNENCIRIYVQMIDGSSNRLEWSKMYQRKLNPKNMFDVQDEIAKEAKVQLEHCAYRKRTKNTALSLVAVA